MTADRLSWNAESGFNLFDTADARANLPFLSSNVSCRTKLFGALSAMDHILSRQVIDYVCRRLLSPRKI